MSGASLAFDSPSGAPRWKRWLLYSALARITLFGLLAAGSMFASVWLFSRAVGGNELPREARVLVVFLVQTTCFVAAYLFLVRVIEQRRPRELFPQRGLVQLAAGTLAGASLMAVIVALLWLAGAYRVTGTNPDIDWWIPLLTIGLGAAVSEEIAFRGVLFRIVEEAGGTWWALIVSALVFGGVHLGNPGATPWSAAAIAMEAGLMLGMVYHLTRSLPLCIGIHLGWNFMQGTVFGIPVSGATSKGWLISQRPGPDWLSGGEFGAEASVVAVIVCTLITAAMLTLAQRRKSLVPQRRHRPMMETPTSAQTPC